jgi:hypothetical protein
MLMVHSIWSISTPIALIEACVPERARIPWLGRVGLVIVGLVFLLGAVAGTAMGFRQDHYMASTAQFIWSAVAIVLLVALAFRMPVFRRYAAYRMAPSAWILGAVSLVLASAAMLVPMNWGWGAVATLLGLDAAMLITVLVWMRMGAMTLQHQLAMGAGAALAYGWHAFMQHPVVGQLDAGLRVGNAVFLIGAIGLIWLGAKRITEFSGKEEPISPLA